MATACFFGLVAFFFNAARASYFAPRWRPQEQPTCPVPLRVLASFSMLFPTPYVIQQGWIQAVNKPDKGRPMLRFLFTSKVFDQC